MVRKVAGIWPTLKGSQAWTKIHKWFGLGAKAQVNTMKPMKRGRAAAKRERSSNCLGLVLFM